MSTIPRRAPWLFRLLVRLYPDEFRRGFGRAVEADFAASLGEAEGRGARLGVWIRAMGDLAGSIPREHWDTWFEDGRGWEMTGWIADLGRAARSLARTPSFTAVVVLTLGLGIGATTSIYSVVYGVLLAPLPYPDEARIMSVSEHLVAGGQNVSSSYVNGLDWKRQQTTFEAIALLRAGAMTLTTGDGAQQLSALFADPEYFEVFGARASLGRLFGTDENRVPGGHPIAVLTHGAWSRLFGADPSVVGSSVTLNGAPFTVLGILSEDYRDPFPGANGAGNDVVLPAMMAGQIDPRGDAILEVRRWRTFGAVGKTLPGATREAAEADLQRIAAELEAVDPVNRGMSATVVPLNEANTTVIRGPALMLLAGALVLLLIACFNVANLILVRGAARVQEVAVQLALGAGRPRIFRLLIAESTVLAMAGGALGVALAVVGLPSLLRMVPNQLPATSDVQVNLPVLAAAFATTLLAGVGFGLLPAVRHSRGDLRASISGSGRTTGGRRSRRVRSGLVLFEIATATILLASSALLVRSFRELASADSGFATENVLTLRVNLPTASYVDDPAMASAAEQITERLAALPGVEWAQPWGPGRPGLSFNFQTSIPEGRLVEQISDSPLARRHHVGPGGLEDLGIGLLRGRTFTAADDADAPLVAIVSESMAEELWPGEDPIGKRYNNFQPPGAPVPQNRSWEVVGVVRDAKHGGRVPIPGAISTANDSYFPLAQRPERSFVMVVKTASAPDLGPIREAIRAFDPAVPIFQVATMEENFAQEQATPRFAAQLMGSFGLAALLLAALGVYGVISFTVSERTREIGLRSALGADRATTLRQVVWSGLRLAAVGVVLGSLGAFSATRGMQSVLPGVPDMEPASVAVAAVALVAVALGACLVPAVRATRIAPVVALKEG